MRYPVTNIMKLDNDTVVAIEGNGEGLYNGALINDGRHTVISVGMKDGSDFGRSTIMLIKGSFDEEVIEI